MNCAYRSFYCQNRHAMTILAAVLFLLIASTDKVEAQHDCTALFNEHCGCSGCSSFRQQKNLLISPPSLPTVLPPGSAEFLPAQDFVPEAPNAETPQDFPLELPAQDPTFDSPSFPDPITTSDPVSPPPIESPLDSVPVPDFGFAQQVPSSQVPNDQSVADPVPLAGQQALEAVAPSPSLFAASSGSTNAGAGIPAMLGDFCGLGARPFSPIAAVTGAGGLTPSSTPVAGGDCRHKWAEFTAPCPTDRVFFSYHHYNNGLVDVNLDRGDADQFTFGFEKTFWDNLASFETRMSFLGAGLESSQLFGSGDTFGAELGNLATTFKVLLINQRRHAVSTGITTIWPTGDDGLFDSIGGQIEIRNQSIHVMPFVAWLYRPNSLWFHQANAQLDFDPVGDTVLFQGARTDVIQDQTFLYLDYSIGRWLYSNNYRFIRRMAGLFELHYSTSIDDADQGNSLSFAGGHDDVLNATAGLHFQLGNATTFRIGGGAPLRTGNSRAFDSEVTLQLARFF